MSLFVILLGGDLARTARLDRQVAGGRFIAADSGIRHAATLGAIPELWTGDFDSCDGLDVAPFDGIPKAVYPPEKDRTDGEIAVDTAIERGASRLVLAGAFGGSRTDHAFLHLTAAMRLTEEGFAVLLTSGLQEGYPLLPANARRFDLEEGTLFSILAFSALSGLTIEGAQWPLKRVEVPFGSSLTLSNRVRGGLRVSLEKGRALLIAHPEDRGGAAP